MNLRSSTALSHVADVPGVRRLRQPAVTYQIPPKLPRVGCTALGVGLFAYDLHRSGLHEAAETIIRDSEIATGMAGEEEP